ncbi:MAG: dockerin type I domain-containing protein [Planctomycetota bacterium]
MLGFHYPESFTSLQIHGADNYTTAWGDNRRTVFYAPWNGYPSVFIGGEYLHLGGGNILDLYDEYLQRYLAYQAQGTDVSIDAGAVYLGGTTYQVSVQVCLDADGDAKTLRVYVANALKYYPGGSYYNHTLMDPAPTSQDVFLQPGECVILTRDLTFNAESWNRQSYIEVFAWAQEALDSWPAEIHNAVTLPWPLTHLTPVGDLNCDGLINAYDIDGFICALSPGCDYAGDYPDCDSALADCNRDGGVNAYDIDAFIALLAGG